LPARSPIFTGRQNALFKAADARLFIMALCGNPRNDSLHLMGLVFDARSGFASLLLF